MAKPLPPLPAIKALRDRVQAGETIPPAELQWVAATIDHTLLKPEATEAQITQLCEEAKVNGFATVCVYPQWLGLCTDLLQGTRVKPIAVIGFPTGLEPTSEKTKQTEAAVAAGALEIDMVINTKKLKARELHEVLFDIHAVCAVAQGRPVKVILETALLTFEEKVLACAQVKAGGAAFVKTSTGFSTGGATVADVELLRKAVGPNFGVKASGGIRTTLDALNMLAAGANRIGASASVAIVGGKAAGESGY